MGEVYRATHLKLGRDAAIKILPGDVASDPERLQRFEREARTASSLNHPNIVTVYDIDERDGVHYIAMELVEGRTLRDWLAEGPLPTADVLGLATQIAEGLAIAHAAGVVHRDLKPENLMISDEGLLKILDFGLAKLRPRSEGVASELSTVEQATRAGRLLGTAPYMSPEQAAGRVVDHRSDQFSFGSILYEMATGRRAFSKDTTPQTLAAIIEDEPQPVTELNSNVPVAVARVIGRCLSKKASERYASTWDLATDLRAEERAASVPGGATAVRSATPRGVRYALAAALALAVGLLTWPSRPARESSEWVRLTEFPDSATSPALSRDGRMLAFLRGPGTFTTTGQIYVKMLPEGEAVQLTHDAQLKMGPVFSPDGSHIVYTVPWDTWQVPVLGGEPRLWLPNASGLTWIGERQILFSEIKAAVHMAIVTSTEDRAGARDVYVPEHETMMAHRSSLSPDGSWALVVEMETGPIAWLPCRLVSFAGGFPERQVGPPRSRCTGAAWSPDGRWMYFAADVGSGSHLWRQPFPDGPPEQLTFGPTEEEGIVTAPDGRSLITSVGLRQNTVWLADAGGERQISSEGDSQLSEWGDCFSPDGRRLYYLKQRRLGISGRTRREQTEASELWLADLETGRSERVLSGFDIQTYDISEDGRTVVFKTGVAGESALWIASLDRRTAPRPLTSSKSFRGGVLLVGEHIYFADAEGEPSAIHRMHVEDGKREIVVPNANGLQSVSPDGQWIVAVAPAPDREESLASVAYPVKGGSPVPVCDSICNVRWDPTGQYLYLSFYGAGDAGVAKTFVIPLTSGQTLPDLPASGLNSEEQVKALPGVWTVKPGGISPGPTPSLYAFTRPVVHRNLYRIPIP